MNLVEELLKSDSKKADELKTERFLSEKLAYIMGKEKPVEITIREIPARRLNDLLAKQYTSKGNFDMTKSFDAKALAVAEGVINPDLKNEQVQQHFGCTTSKDLAVKLFGNEITAISDAIVMVSGYKNIQDTDEEIKN